MTQSTNRTDHTPTIEATRMSTLRTRTRWIYLPAIALVGLTAACADAPTAAPAAPATPAPSLSKSSTGGTSYVVSQLKSGDTTVTVFVVGTNSLTAATFDIGHSSRIDFPYAASSICDLATSTYGPTEWDKPCTASSTAVQITAKSWINAKGKLETDFQPAMRFVPGLRKLVTITLKDAALAGTRIDFCTLTGCINEALTDPSLTTQLDPRNGFATRIIKHFSGYTVTAD